MARSPRYKIYIDGSYMASCKDIIGAIVLMSFYGDHSTVRDGHSHVIFAEGVDGVVAEIGYDRASRIAVGRTKGV